MKNTYKIASAALAASLLVAGHAVADRLDNPGEFLAVIAEGGAPGDYIQFLTFSTGANARLPNGVGEFTFGVSDGTTGAIDYGWHSFPEGPARDSGGAPLSYGGRPILVRFDQAGAPVPLSGAADAAHGDFSFTFGGRLRFRPESAGVTGFTQCVTPYFTVTVTDSGGFPPGTNFVDQIDLDGVTMSTGTVSVNGPLCDLAAASAINSAFGAWEPDDLLSLESTLLS